MSEADIPPRACLPLSITCGESFHAKGTLQCQGHPFPTPKESLRGGEESLGYLDRFLQKGGIPDL